MPDREGERPADVRSLRFVPLVGILVVGVAVATWVVVDTARDAPRFRRHREGRPGPAMRFLGPSALPTSSLSGRYAAVGGQPRLFANLAACAGPYLVSVRQIFAEDRVRTMTDLLPPGPIAAAPLGRCHLVLQVDPLEKGSPEPGLDMNSLRAVTEGGQVLARTAGPPDLESRLPLPNGWALRAFLQPVPPHETLLREITGVLMAGRDGSAGRHAFRVTNTPLPTHPRLFGDIVPVRIKQRDRPSMPGRQAVLVGAAAESQVLHERDSAQERLPYLRLVLADGRAGDLSATLGRDFPSFVLTARALPDGNIEVYGSVGAKRWQVTVWDREPFVVPVTSGRPGRRGVQIMLSRSPEPVFLPMVQSLFPPSDGEAAGSLAFYMRVTERPVGPAMLPFSLQKWEEGAWSASRGSSAPVRASGLVVIGGLAPGRYRLSLHPERVAPMGAVKPVSYEEYLRARYRVAPGAWRNAVQELMVAQGRRTYAAPLRLDPARRPAGRRGN